MSDKKHWMQDAFKKKPGALHKQLGVKPGETIPKSKLKPKESDSETTRKRKQLAQTASKIARKNK
jgi:hypothetical protein